MNIPNYFLHDLPPDALLAPAMITDACHALKRNRARYLLPRSTEELIRTFDSVARQWLLPDFPWRQLALERGPEKLHFSRETLERGLASKMRSRPDLAEPRKPCVISAGSRSSRPVVTSTMARSTIFKSP